MGVVYKAEDARLKRTVALKFLPRGLESHEGERARFLHEAQAASALNHPNVCTIYDIGEAEGQQFIVMEYVDGVTMREKIAEGKLTTGNAVGYAIQIGEALEEAHGKGIVHRDIKAENIMVTTKNQVKVMDFGLAKLKGSLKRTKTSSTVGTLAYMAPEQIQGGQIDARNDIFSFGVVLYEMLTGHLPFRGEHEAAMMYSILNEEPVSLQTYLPDAPSELLHTVNRALEKDPEERYQTVHEMLIDLRRLRKESSKVARPVLQAETPLPKEVPASPAGEPRQRKTWLWSVAVGLIVVGLGLAILFLQKTRGVKLNPNRTFSTLSIPFRRLSYPSVSRDGNWVIFSAEDENGTWDVYWMNIAGGEPSKITREGWAGINSVDISPDARQVAYDCRKGDNFEIRIVPLQGGASRTVADTGEYARWRPDGKRIGYMRRGGPVAVGSAPSRSGRFEVWSVKLDGSDNRVEFIDSLNAIGGAALSFCWSPDGASIAWVRYFSPVHGEVMVRELSTGRERQLTSDNTQVDEVIWTTSENILFKSDKSGHSNLWVLPSAGGEPTQVTEGSVPIIAARISADNRRLIYYQSEEIWQIWISAVDGSNARQVTFDDIRVEYPALSPDGNHIACVLRDVDYFRPETHLYLMDRQGKNRRGLTVGSEIVSLSRWSPDGKWLAYLSRPAGEPWDSNGVYLIQPFNPGAPRLLCRGTRLHWIDSENLVVAREMKTWRYSTAGGMPRQVFKDSTFAIPLKNMNQICFMNFRKGQEGIWLASVDSVGKEVEGKRRPLLPPNILQAFSPDGGILVYQKLDPNEIWRVWLTGGRTERIGAAPSGTTFIQDVSMNGKEILWLKGASRDKLAVIENPFE